MDHQKMGQLEIKFQQFLPDRAVFMILQIIINCFGQPDYPPYERRNILFLPAYILITQPL